MPDFHVGDYLTINSIISILHTILPKAAERRAVDTLLITRLGNLWEYRWLMPCDYDIKYEYRPFRQSWPSQYALLIRV